MQRFIDDLIETIRTGNLSQLMTYFVPRFILGGVILLALTLLGPFGILIGLGVLGGFVYRYLIR